jgi:nicotinate-nucleotide pyrophosphorylase (carboxylating)
MKNLELPSDTPSCIQRALEEDIGTGDVTTNSIVPSDALLRGHIVAKQPGVIAGLSVARAVLNQIDSAVVFSTDIAEGSKVAKGTIVVQLHGNGRALLTGERTALNFLGRMSGVATLTRQFVDAVAGTNAIILDTRKTVPGLRSLDKLAVRLGGGENHRIGLFDMILIKDNHIDFAGSITAAVQRARAANSNLEIEVETRTLNHVREAIELDVNRILLDNMSTDMMREAVEFVAGRARLEASGNITLETVGDVARTGVNYISVGALTHSPKVFDVSLEWTG